MLNQTMIVNGRGMTIVGVGQRGFASEKPGSVPELFVPLSNLRTMDAQIDANVANELLLRCVVSSSAKWR